MNDLIPISEDDCLLDIDEAAWNRVIEKRGGCRCCISPPCAACTEPIDEPELNDVGYTYAKATPAAQSQPVTPDPEKWCEYVAGMIFGWLQMQKHLPDEDRCIDAIAGIIRRRLWAYKPSQPVTLTDDVPDPTLSARMGMPVSRKVWGEFKEWQLSKEAALRGKEGKT